MTGPHPPSEERKGSISLAAQTRRTARLRRARLMAPPNAKADPGLALRPQAQRQVTADATRRDAPGGMAGPNAAAVNRSRDTPAQADALIEIRRVLDDIRSLLTRAFGPPRAAYWEAISIQLIQETVAAFFGVTVEHLKATRGDSSVMQARHIAVYLARTLTLCSFPQIGACFGGRNHATVRHSYQKIREAIATHRPTADAVRELTAMLRKRQDTTATGPRRSRAATK